MSNYILWIVTLLYLITSINLLLSNNKQMALVFLGYVIANIGLLMQL